MAELPATALPADEAAGHPDESVGKAPKQHEVAGKEAKEGPEEGMGGEDALIRAVLGPVQKPQMTPVGDKQYQCRRCFEYVAENEKVTTGKLKNSHLCHSCNRSSKKESALRESAPELVESFLAMDGADLKGFLKAHQDLSLEALKKEVSLKVAHYKKLVQEEISKNERIPLPLTLLANMGYSQEQLASIEQTCDKEWNPEIKDPCVASISINELPCAAQW
jgi:hypothetical protein